LVPAEILLKHKESLNERSVSRMKQQEIEKEQEQNLLKKYFF